MTDLFNSAPAQRMVLGSFALLLVFLAAWEWGPAAVGVPPYIVPKASSVWNEFWVMLDEDRLMYHTLITSWLVLVGFVLGMLLGMIAGYLLGASPTAEFVLSPYILALQIAPKVAFAPLFVIWFGFTDYPKILVAILIVFFPILVNVLGAMRAIDPDIVRLAKSFNATRMQIFRKIEFPASLPPLFAGLRIAATLAVIGVVVGELVGGNTGLGYLLTLGDATGNTAKTFVSIIMLTVVGIVLYGAIVLIEARVLHFLPARARQGA